MNGMFGLVLLLTGLVAGTAALACPDYDLAAQEAYRATGAELRRPVTFVVVAGGNHDLDECTGIRPASETGPGFFPAAPDFSFDLTGMRGLRLVLSLVSECDAALLVNTATASWYYDDDDNGNLDPGIVLTRPADGRLDIWVGSYDGAFCNARLTLETFTR